MRHGNWAVRMRWRWETEDGWGDRKWRGGRGSDEKGEGGGWMRGGRVKDRGNTVIGDKGGRARAG